MNMLVTTVWKRYNEFTQRQKGGRFVNLYKLFTKSVMIFNTWKDYNIGNGGNL